MVASISHSNWMAGIPGNINLAGLALPGTHNSGANYLSLDNNFSIANVLRPIVPDLPFGLDEQLLKALGAVDPALDAILGFYALNQESSISEQLSKGIRYLDLRFNYDQARGKMLIAHGPVNYKELDLVMQEIEAWLAANPTETILLSPRIYNGHSDVLMKKYFHDRYVYKAQADASQVLRKFSANDLAVNPYADELAKQTPLFGKDIYLPIQRLPSLDEARGKIVLLDPAALASLTQSGLLGTTQNAWDSSSLKQGIQEKIKLITDAVVAIAKDDPRKLVQNHFQLSAAQPRFGDFLPSTLSGWYELARKALTSGDVLNLILQRVFTPLSPSIGFASQLNVAALELLKGLPSDKRTRGLWVGDFTDGSSDFIRQGAGAITSLLGLPEDTSKLSVSEQFTVNLLLQISQQLQQAADVTSGIVQQNGGAIIGFSNKIIKEGGSSELQIAWYEPSISSLYFSLTPSSRGASIEDLLMGESGSPKSGYSVSKTNSGWQGSVEKNAGGYITIYALMNQDSEEIPESFSLQLYRDSLRQQKLGESVSISVTPSSKVVDGAQFAYTIAIDIADAPWAGSGDEGSSAFRAPSAIRLLIKGTDEQNNPIQAELELSAENYNQAINGSRLSPFQRGASDRFNVLLDRDFRTIKSVTLAASKANKDSIDLRSLSINRLPPLNDSPSSSQATRLFQLDFERDAVKISTLKDGIPSSHYLYKSGLTKEGAYKINTSSSIDFELVPYLGGANDRVATSKGDVWFHVLDQNGERTPVSLTKLNPDLPTFIITHGFTGGSGDNWLAGRLPGFSATAKDWKLNTKDLLQWQAFYGDDHLLALSVQEAYRDANGQVQANVVLADWGNFSVTGTGALSYASYAKVAEENVPAAGRAIADYIKHQGIDPAKLTLLGHSLGGHVMGFAGQGVQDDVRKDPAAYQDKGKEVASIIAMDPAGPMFETWAPDKRLSNGDAGRVVAIHTDSLMGFDAPLGSHDLYMNAYYAITNPGVSPEEFVRRLETISDGSEQLYRDSKPNDAYSKYIDEGLPLSWDPAFTWYQLKTETNPEDGRQWFEKQHNYSMATLANLFLEDKRLQDPAWKLPSWLGGSVTDNIDPNLNSWTKTFKGQLEDFRAVNDQLKLTGIPATFSTLAAGNSPGGLFSGKQPLSWFSDPAKDQTWSGFPYTFLKPDRKFQADTSVPFSDYAYFWNDTGNNLADLATEEIKKALAGRSNTISQLISGFSLSKLSEFGGPEYFNRYLSPDFGLANGQGISLGGTSILDRAGAVALSAAAKAYAAYNSLSGWINTIYGLKQKVFGGPVVNGNVVLDLRSYDQSGSTLTQNLNLTIDANESAGKTDATGSFSLGMPADPKTLGNRDGILDFRDGLVIAGSRKQDGSISVQDSISGSDYGFPLVGLPGGNITLLTTLKYATLLRWTPTSSLFGQTLGPDLITQVFSQIIKDVPRAFIDDSFNPYSAISSKDAAVRQEGIKSLSFAYSHLAVIKVLAEMLKASQESGANSFGLLYGNNSPEDLALWGRPISDPLNPAGVDRSELVAFTAYGLAIQQSFTAERPFDPGNADHLREVLVNVLSSYPTQAILSNQTELFRQQFAIVQQAGKSEQRDLAIAAVKAAIEQRVGGTLTNLSQGLCTINSVLNSRFHDAEILSNSIPSAGTQLLIPTMAGPKRFMADTLSKDLVLLAQQFKQPAEFAQEFNRLLLTPLTIDDPKRQPTYLLSATLADGKSSARISGNQASARFTVKIADALGNPQPAPDYGLAVRFRLGGNAVEGHDYEIGDDLACRLLSIAPGESEISVEIPVDPATIQRGNAFLQLELLSADSGYGVDGKRAVVTALLGPRAVEPTAFSGERSAFVPHALVTSSQQGEAWLTASRDQGNAILRGMDGRKDFFVIGGQYQGMPHIENFNPNDGDKIMLDQAVWADNTQISINREQLGSVVNTYAGYVFDLLSGRPLALISSYSADLGDRAWTGLSSDINAPYYDLAPIGRSAGVEISGRTFVRGSIAQISLDPVINTLIGANSALELIAIDKANPAKRQVVMTTPGTASGLPATFTGNLNQLGFIGRLADDANGYQFALRNLSNGQLVTLQSKLPSDSETLSASNVAFMLENPQGVTLATVSTFNELDGSKPVVLTEEMASPAFGADPVIGISLSNLGSALNDDKRSLKVGFDVFREAHFENRLGLYLADRQTLSPLDLVTGKPVLNAETAQQALRNPNSIAAWLGPVVDKGASQIEATLVIPDGVNAGEVVLLPYLVSGDPWRSLILPASSMNQDRSAHLRLMGLNTLGFEDLMGASSDWDCDDVIAKVNSVQLVSI